MSVRLASSLARNAAREDRVRGYVLHRLAVTRLWCQAQFDRLGAGVDGDVRAVARHTARLEALVDVDLDLVGDDDLVDRWLDAIAEMEEAIASGGAYRDLIKRSVRAFLDIRDALDGQRERALGDLPLEARHKTSEQRADRLERRLEHYARRVREEPLSPWRARLRRYTGIG